MKIRYKNHKLYRVCTNAAAARKAYGGEMARRIHQRIDELTAADTVEMMVRYHIGRCHALTGNRAKQYALDLVHPYRLVFTVEHGAIQIADILEIVDYH